MAGGNAYLLGLAGVLVPCLIGLVLRRRIVFLGAVSALAAAGAALALHFAAGQVWMLSLASLIVCPAVLWAPTVLSQRAGRLWSPVALTLAVTCTAVAVTFSARAAPQTYLALAVHSSDHAAKPPMYMSETINFSGCGNPVTADVYWGLHWRWYKGRSQKLAAQNADELMAFGHSEAVLTAGAAQPFPVEHFVDNARFATGGRVVSARALKLLRPVSRGFGSCYLVVPRLVGPDNPVIGDQDALPLKAAENDLSLGGGGLSVASGTAPTSAGDPSRWLCSSATEASLLPTVLSAGLPPGKRSLGAPGTDCGAVVMLTDPWYQTFQDVMLLVIGALTAALVGLGGYAARESHRLAEQ